MDNIKNVKKIWLSSLSFLDNNIINAIIVIILVLYSSNIFSNINNFIGNLYNFSIVRLIVLLLIIYITPKDQTIGILLAISYIISLNYSNTNEPFMSPLNLSEDDNKGFNLISDENKPNRYLNEGYSDMMNNTIEEYKHMSSEEHSKNDRHRKSDKNHHIIKDNLENEDNDSTIESFFPFDIRNNKNVYNNDIKMPEVNNNCLNNYTPHYESISDVCAPTETFKHELNAQGLNNPEGFNSPDFGSPI